MDFSSFSFVFWCVCSFALASERKGVCVYGTRGG
jgi:hypothetical protein